MTLQQRLESGIGALFVRVAHLEAENETLTGRIKELEEALEKAKTKRS